MASCHKRRDTLWQYSAPIIIIIIILKKEWLHMRFVQLALCATRLWVMKYPYWRCWESTSIVILIYLLKSRSIICIIQNVYFQMLWIKFVFLSQKWFLIIFLDLLWIRNELGEKLKKEVKSDKENELWSLYQIYLRAWRHGQCDVMDNVTSWAMWRHRQCDVMGNEFEIMSLK